MHVAISDAFRHQLAELIKSSGLPPADQARMLSFIDKESTTDTPVGMHELDEFVSRSDVKAALAHHPIDFAKLSAHIRNVSPFAHQAMLFGDTPPVGGKVGYPPLEAMIEETAQRLEHSPYINYAAHQKDYFLRHYRKFLDDQGHAASVVNLNSGNIRTFTSMSEEERSEYVYDISALQNDPGLIGAAKGVVVAMLELNGGLGSSIGLDPAKHHAKSTGIMIPAQIDTPEGPQTVFLSIMEAKVRALVSMLGFFRELHLFPLNSTITRDGWASFMTSPSLETRTGHRSESATNRAIFKEAGLVFRSEVLQEGFPKISQKTLLPIQTGDSDSELAPGGHGQILFELYSSSYLDKLVNQGVEVLVIGNADGKQARPNPAVVAKIVQDKIPAALISTDRTAIDAKGGIFAVEDGKLTIIERSQVDKPQLPLFESIGLQEGNAPQPFNTNTVYINIPLFLKILAEVEQNEGKEAVLRMLMPTTIANKKKVAVGGEELPVYILEGAIASVVLKFPGVKIFNASVKDRWTQFTPVKGPADVVYLYNSDVFTIDAMTGDLRPQVPNPVPPSITLGEWKGWERLQETLDAFGQPSMKDLKHLTIRGAVSPKNAIFRGRVEITSESKQIIHLNNATYASQLPREHGRIILEDVRIHIDADGKMVVEASGMKDKGAASKRIGGIIASVPQSGQKRVGEGVVHGGFKFLSPEGRDRLPFANAANVMLPTAGWSLSTSSIAKKIH